MDSRRSSPAEDDRCRIVLMLDDLFGEVRESYADRLRKHTRRLVERHAGKILRVAAALIEKRTLTAIEIDEITGLSSYSDFLSNSEEL